LMLSMRAKRSSCGSRYVPEPALRFAMGLPVRRSNAGKHSGASGNCTARSARGLGAFVDSPFATGGTRGREPLAASFISHGCTHGIHMPVPASRWIRAGCRGGAFSRVPGRAVGRGAGGLPTRRPSPRRIGQPDCGRGRQHTRPGASAAEATLLISNVAIPGPAGTGWARPEADVTRRTSDSEHLPAAGRPNAKGRGATRGWPMTYDPRPTTSDAPEPTAYHLPP